MNRWVLAILALVIGFGVGWWVFHAKQSVAVKLAGQQVKVKVFQKDDNDNAKPDVEPEKAVVHADDVVVWRHSGKKAKDIHIEFKEEVFYGMTQVGTAPNIRWAISCSGQGCGSLWPKVGPSDYEYKYWQRVNDPGKPDGNPQEQDGWIIIR